ncbi:MAG: sugar phosphate isomerase/epimerase family protein [Bdellovibrionales bacterium]
MQLGFVTAILPDLSFEEVLAFAAAEGFQCVEVMCWPPGKADRRYAGVTHIDVTTMNEDQAGQIKELVKKYGVAISALGYYPNCLDPDADKRQEAIDHLKNVISAAPHLDVGTVTTFIGRDPTLSVEECWPLVRQIWPAIVKHAETEGVKIGVENCPMIFSLDEWPGGKNLAYSPAIWRRLFTEIPSPNLGLNFDPSHLLWLGIDCVRAVKEFAHHIHHVHAKDTKIDRDKLYEEGVMGLGWNTPKIPGYGEVAWGPYFSALSDIGYKGPVCIEVEDRAFEDSLEGRMNSLRQSKKFLQQFIL